MEFLLTVIRLTTSSSKEVNGYIVPAESISFVPKVQARTLVESSYCTQTPPPPRDSRRKNSQKRIGAFVSKIFACVSPRKKSVAEEQKMSPIDPTLADMEIKRRRVSELTGSDFPISPSTPLDKYYMANDKSISAVSEMSHHSLPAELYSAPLESTGDVQGGCDYFSASTRRRRGACRDVYLSDHNTCTTPIAELFVPLPESISDGNSGSALTSEVIQAAVTTGSYKPLHPTNSNSRSLAIAQPLRRPTPSLDVSVHDCAQAVPDLSPQTATQKSSSSSPETPNATGDVSFLLQRSQAALENAVSPNESTTSPNQYFKPFDYSMSPNYWDFDESTLVQPMDRADSSMLAAQWFENNRQQVEANAQGNWPLVDPTITPPGLQQTNVPPTSSFLEDDESIRRIKELLGTWEMIGDSTWARNNGHESADDDVGVELNHAEPSFGYENRLLPSYYEEPVPADLVTETNYAVKKEYPLVNCDVCGEQYTGQYGPGNLKRHVNQKHALRPRIDYSCRVCKRSYKRSDALRHHERQKHSSSIKAKSRTRCARK